MGDNTTKGDVLGWLDRAAEKAGSFREAAARIRNLEAENERLRENQKLLRENQKRLLSALRSLYDGQVYHPKESDFYTWNRAMDFADIVLRDLEADDE
jgi:predicted nuclease with TOPRIM domain